MEPTDRRYAEALDHEDPLASLLAESIVVEPDVLYLNGNSLGRLTHRVRRRLLSTIADEWATGLVRSWDSWIDLPSQIGDALAEHLLGARPGEVVVGDSTTVNLYKAAAAAIAARPDGRAVVTDDDNFPTDRYVLEGLAAQHGLEYREVPSDPVTGPDPDTLTSALDGAALLCLSHVAYRSGALADMAGLTALAHDADALVLWDLSHAVGSVPIDLTASSADLAVGCTYKYLNGGPGSPAFSYVRRELIGLPLSQPIWGWFGQQDQFAMAHGFQPVAGIGSWLTGSPAVLGLVCVEEGVALLAEAGIARLRTKGMALTSLLVDLADAWLTPLGFSLASPRAPERRGSHVALAHSEAPRIAQALVEAGVVVDFRAPDRLRLGPAPVATRFVDVWDALDRLRQLAQKFHGSLLDKSPFGGA